MLRTNTAAYFNDNRIIPVKSNYNKESSPYLLENFYAILFLREFPPFRAHTFYQAKQWMVGIFRARQALTEFAKRHKLTIQPRDGKHAALLAGKSRIGTVSLDPESDYFVFHGECKQSSSLVAMPLVNLLR